MNMKDKWHKCINRKRRNTRRGKWHQQWEGDQKEEKNQQFSTTKFHHVDANAAFHRHTWDGPLARRFWPAPGSLSAFSTVLSLHSPSHNNYCIPAVWSLRGPSKPETSCFHSIHTEATIWGSFDWCCKPPTPPKKCFIIFCSTEQCDVWF